ncbi:MAG: tetratricopeptide repeat protein [Terracidiphilus sp.]
MGILSHLFYPWGLLLQAAAIIHFIRRRPGTYWLFIILFLGPIGALVYLFAEVLPDIGLLNQSFKGISRGNRINALELAIRDNPSVGNYEELGELLMENGRLQQAREAFDKAIAARSTTLEIFYHRGVCAILLGDATGALPDLEKAVAKDPQLDFNRAPALLAHAYALTGQPEKAEALFRKVTALSTLSETYLNFADFLASQGRPAEAREWAQKVLDKEPTMPRYLRRRERPWSRRARKILKQLPA